MSKLAQPMPEDFEMFYQAYPLHRAKLEALKAWKQLKPSPEQVALMLEALDWQREQWHDLKFVPYPATWLRAGRWMDEPPRPRERKADTWVCPHVTPCSHWSRCELLLKLDRSKYPVRES